MRRLTQKQLCAMDAWMQQYARPYDRAKWNYLFCGGSKDAIVDEMLRYQNPDGGMGSGFEPDVLCPLSAAIPTAEAIFQAYDYDLDCKSHWFASILCYFENTLQDIPKYWEDCPKEAMDYPHAPWWSYAPCTTFNPNPCAAVASAMIRYGSESQRTLGMKIAEDCFDLLVSDKFCGDHDSLNIIALIEQLSAIGSPLITHEIIAAMKRRIGENTCFDSSKWQEYTFAPLDFVFYPDSMWYDCVSCGIEENIEYWLDTIDDQGIWNPNFSWGIDSDVSRQVTENWKGYITVKRAKILLSFDRIEK